MASENLIKVCGDLIYFLTTVITYQIYKKVLMNASIRHTFYVNLLGSEQYKLLRYIGDL